MNRAIRMHQNDSVAVLLCDVQKGDIIGIYDADNRFLFELEAGEHIPYGNKAALEDIAADSRILKYGQCIGISTKPVLRGSLVHVHNVKSLSVDIPDSIRQEIIKQMHIAD